MLKWIIYYDDGSTFSNRDGRFEDAPSDGVLGIIERDDQVGYVIYYGKDFYFKIDDETIGMTDDIGPFLRLLGVIKFGRWTGRKAWDDSWAKMVELANTKFGNKSGEKTTEDG